MGLFRAEILASPDFKTVHRAMGLEMALAAILKKG
jgi:hypothetical protein